MSRSVTDRDRATATATAGCEQCVDMHTYTTTTHIRKTGDIPLGALRMYAAQQRIDQASSDKKKHKKNTHTHREQQQVGEWACTHKSFLWRENCLSAEDNRNPGQDRLDRQPRPRHPQHHHHQHEHQHQHRRHHRRTPIVIPVACGPAPQSADKERQTEKDHRERRGTIRQETLNDTPRPAGCRLALRNHLLSSTSCMCRSVDSCCANQGTYLEIFFYRMSLPPSSGGWAV